MQKNTYLEEERKHEAARKPIDQYHRGLITLRELRHELAMIDQGLWT